MNIQMPRGTYDLFDKEMRLHNEVKNSVLNIFDCYGYNQIKTPIFEHTNLFLRSVGEASDIVNKEMYTFYDKSDRSLTLRPELTASTARCYLEHKMFGEARSFHKLCYYGEAFRYERSQAGRYRQFHQLGVECFGIDDIHIETETISMAQTILKDLNIDNGVTLKINTLGSSNDREQYIELLREYFANEIDNLCDDCKMRFEKNPLRILDCKIDNENEIVQNAPILFDSLSEQSKNRFNKLLKLLEQFEIDYTVDYSLVRGLDYYNDTVFEFSNDVNNLAILGGGRYDTLINKLNGKYNVSAFGLGIGLERLIITIKEANPHILEKFAETREIFYMPRCDEAKPICLKSIELMRSHGLKCEMDYNISSFKSAFKQAENFSCVYAVIIGEREIADNYVTIKNLYTKESFEVNLNDFEQDIINEGEQNEQQ